MKQKAAVVDETATIFVGPNLGRQVQFFTQEKLILLLLKKPIFSFYFNIFLSKLNFEYFQLRIPITKLASRTALNPGKKTRGVGFLFNLSAESSLIGKPAKIINLS